MVKQVYQKGPWKIIYKTEYPDWITERKNEKYLKSAAGKKWFEKYLPDNGGDIEFCADSCPAISNKECGQAGVTQAGNPVRATTKTLIEFKTFSFPSPYQSFQ
jgi:hypothetical protein